MKSNETKLRKFIRRIGISLGVVIILALVTLFIGWMMGKERLFFIGGSEDGWLGYWGSIVGILGAYFVLKIQLKSEDIKHKADSVDNTFFNLLTLHNDVIADKEEVIDSLYTELEQNSNNLINTIRLPKDVDKKLINIPEEDIKNSVSEIYKNNFVEFGYYFRLFYRIIKFINTSFDNKYINEAQRDNYIGLLRAVLDEKTMAIIFYNATYLNEGKNMKKELRENYFFGRPHDFINTERKHNLFSNGTLLFYNDYDKLKELTKAEKKVK